MGREYFDKYLFEGDPALLREVAERLAPLVPDSFDALAGVELGGVPIATVLSQVTGIPALFVRKQAKEYGTRRLGEAGEVAGKRLLVVEDVVTSAGRTVPSRAARLSRRRYPQCGTTFRTTDGRSAGDHSQRGASTTFPVDREGQ